MENRSDAPPSSPSHDLPNCCWGYFEHLRNGSVTKLPCGVYAPQSQNSFLRQFGSSVVLAKRNPALLHLVMHVFKLCTGSQMGRITALRASYTRMQNQNPRRNGLPIVNSPSNPMRWQARLSCPKSTVQPRLFWMARSGPRPTLIRCFNLHLGPKTFLSFGSKNLLKKFAGDRIYLHQSLWLIVCRAFGCFSNARALLF